MVRVPGAVIVLSAVTLTLFACSDSDPSPTSEASSSTVPSAEESDTASDPEPDDQDTGQGDQDTGQGDGAGEGGPDAEQGGQDTATLLIGRWLGPEPGMNQRECENGTTEYSFEPDGTWLARNVNIDECGGTFTIGGTYTVPDDDTMVLHFTRCPQSCSQFPDATVRVDFIDDDNVTFSDDSFTGTYHRQ